MSLRVIMVLTAAAAVAAAVDTVGAADSVAVADTPGVVETMVVPDTAVADYAETASAADSIEVKAAYVNTAAAVEDSVAAYVYTPAVDTVTEDTLPAVNTALIDTLVIDTAVSGTEVDIYDPDLGTLAAAPVNLLRMAVFAASLFVVIIVFLRLFFKNRGKRRFLTTMRLSVLDRNVQKACRYIESRFDDPNLTVESVCRELVTGEAYLNTLFVKELGIDVRDFITQVRINGVKFFLREYPNRGIEKICVQCGFESRAAAERPFARICGTEIDEYVRTL